MSRMLLSGGLLFDGENAPVPGHGVLVEDGRIATVAPRDTFSGFAGETVDTAGMTVMPGLIDCHTHLTVGAEPQAVAIIGQLKPPEIAIRTLENAQATLRGGVTSCRDIGGKEYIELTVRDAIDAGRHLGPSVHCAGRVICITGGHGYWGGGREVDGPDDTVRGVRENIKAGADFIKFIATGGVMTPRTDPYWAQLSPEEIAAGARAAKSLGRKVSAHAQTPVGIGNALAAGVDSIEHGFVLTDELIERMIKQGTWLVPTLIVQFNLLKHAGENIPRYMIEKASRFHNLHRDSVARFYKAGGRIAMGTDTGAPMSFHGENAHELALMAEVGMRPLDVLRASTIGAAELGAFKNRGRIKPGYWADLLVVEGNPAEDIRAAADRKRHRRIFKNGTDVLATLGPPKIGPAFQRFVPGEPPF